MNYFNKSFFELSTLEIFELFKLRISVFVVEQKCPYQEIDDIDLVARHLFIKEDDNFIAYLRIYEDSIDSQVIHIGRVISVFRRNGIGTSLLKYAIEYIQSNSIAKKIIIDAQFYTMQLYSNIGFVQISDVFILDGIEHVKMELLL